MNTNFKFFGNVLANRASKKALNMFDSAITNLEKSNRYAGNRLSVNRSSINKLQIENDNMTELVNKNTRVMKNFQKLLN